MRFTDNGDGHPAAQASPLSARRQATGVLRCRPGQAQYAFDALGKLTTWEDPQVCRAYTYDETTEYRRMTPAFVIWTWTDRKGASKVADHELPM
jgi:hypothetical protein